MSSRIPFRRRRFAEKRVRRGASTAALGATICALIFIVVMAVGVAQLVYHRQQAHVGIDAASLAGVPELMDKRPLYDGMFLDAAAASIDDDTTGEEFLAMIRAQQVASARAMAKAYASENLLDRSPIDIDNDPDDDSDDDIQIGWIDDPSDRNAEMQEESPDGLYPPGLGSLNTIDVWETRSKGENNSLSLWMAEQVGFDDVVLRVSSRATVDQRMIGVRPIAPLSNNSGTNIPRTNVPMLPLFAIPNDLDELDPDPATYNIAHLWWSQGELDDYQVDTRLGQYMAGQDYIAEIVVRIQTSDTDRDTTGEPTSRDGGLLFFADEQRSGDVDEVFERLALMGYQREDFADYESFGSEIRLNDSEMFIASASFTLTDEEIAKLKQVCDDIRGLSRIIPLCRRTQDSETEENDPDRCQIYGFAAGSIVATELGADGSLLIHIQPCVMQTPTAIVGATTLRNPWIGKAVLSR